MYFDLTDDQKQLRDQLDGLLRSQLEPKLMKLYDADDSFDRSLWKSLMELGLGAILLSEEKGGLGIGLLTLAVVSESLGYFAAPAPVPANAIIAWLLAEAGGHDEKVAALVSGEAVGALALAARGGWTTEAWTLSGGRMNGSVSSVEFGSKATHFVVGLSGGRLGIVSKDAPGLSLEEINSVDRTRPIATLEFEDTDIEVLAVDAAIVTRLLQAAIIIQTADACGAAHRALRMSLDYAGVRSQFGRLIGQFQGLKYQLVEMAVEVEPCRPLVWYAAHTWDALPDQVARAAAISKAHVTDVAVRVGRSAVEAHGGIGYTWEYPLHVWLKRAMHDRATYGIPSVHRESAAALANW